MSNETMTGILIAVIFGVASFLVVNKKFNLKIIQRNKSGDNTISNTTIGNEINKHEK